MSETERAQVLQDLLGRIKPKARYVSQMHIEDYTDSVVKEIINGDIDIPGQRKQIQDISSKKDYQSQIRNKFLTKVEREKKILQHKLSYISNSINSLKKYELLKNAGRYSPNARNKSSESAEEQIKEKTAQWKQEIAKRAKEIRQKKEKVQQVSKKKEEEMKEMSQRIKLQEESKKKNQIYQSVQRIKQRMEVRELQVKSGNEKLKEIVHRKKLFEKLVENYHERENSQLEERKKKLAQIRSLHKPVDSNQILEHEQKFIQTKKQKQELRERQKRMNESRSKSYKASYESAFYKKIAEVSEDDGQTSDKIKMEKMKQFAEHVKENFTPAIDETKRKYFEDLKETEEEKQRKKEEKDAQLLQKSKIKGLQYLEMIKKLPKKKAKDNSPQTDRAHQTQKTKYANYLNRSVNLPKKTWTKILTSKMDKQDKTMQIMYESQKVEEQLKRKELFTRVVKKNDNGQIDQQYYEMVKAKLNLLQGPY